jgi:hypothetical protein
MCSICPVSAVGRATEKPVLPAARAWLFLFITRREMHRFELSANLFLYAVFFRVTDLARNEYFNPQPENHDRAGP